jgi:predicted Zn-dependent protease
MKRTRVIAAALMVLSLALKGCTTNPATGQQSFTAFMSPQEEQRVGAEEHPKLVAEMGGEYDDPALAAYVDRVGQSLARFTEIPGQRYTFTIIDSEDVNAFALPGGYVHVTRGLLALASDEAEMAGVLAHELGHITARHAAQRYSHGVATGLGATLLGVLGAIAGLPAATGDLINFGAAAYLQSYSRDQEREADELAIRYMTRAGYDAEAMVSFFRKLDGYARLRAEMAGQPQAVDRFNVMASHPRTSERIENAARLAGAAQPGGQKRQRDAYLAAIDGMVFGDSPAQGLRRGRDFLHPALRIAFTVPPGYSMSNAPDKVVARGPQGAAIVFDSERTAVARSAGGSMTAYLTQVWGRQVRLSEVQALTINGLPAATATTRQQTRSGGLIDLRLVAIRTEPDQIFRFLLLTPANMTARLAPEMRTTVMSFRRLSPAEAAAIKPLRVRVVPVKPGDTAASLTAHQPFGTYNVRWFALLNGLAPSAPLPPGDKVKVVVD